MGRDQQQQIRGAVDLRKLVLRQSAEQPDAARRPRVPAPTLRSPRARPVADDDQIRFRQQRQRFDHQRCRFSATRLPTASKVGRVKPSARRAAARSPGRNSARSTPLRNTLMRSAGVPSAVKPIAQPGRHRDQPSRLRRRPADPTPRHLVVGDQIEIAAARGDDDRPAQRMPEHHRRDPVRVEIMRVDQIEIPARGDLPAQTRQHGGEQGERRGAHADLGQ